MPANMNATNVAAAAVPHVELEMTRADVMAFALQLVEDLLTEPGVARFHLQVQATGVAPPPGGTIPITQLATAKVTLHRFP